MNHVLSDNVSCFIQKPSVAKLLPTRHVMNVLPKLKLFNAMTTSHLLRFSLLIIYSQQNLLYEARSVFEPEWPVRIRTWTWNAGNKRFTSSLNRPDRPWCPPSLLFSGYRVSFPGIKRQGREVASSLLSGAKVTSERSYNITSSVAWRSFLSLVVVFNFSYIFLAVTTRGRVLFSGAYLNWLSVSLLPSNWE